MASTEVEVLDPAGTVEKLKKTASGRALNRRNFMAALGMTGAAAAISGCTATTFPTPLNSNDGSTSASSPAQSDVLNFALNLEYLEATFYSYITQGADLPASATIASGAITGVPSKLTFTGTNAAQITDLLNEIYFDEVNHVLDLRSLLGSQAVPRPAINLAAAGAVTATNALSFARQFEDVGATAYAGAAALLSSTNLTYAAEILAVEGFHSGALRLISIQNPTIAAYVAADSHDVPPADPGTPALAAAGPTGSGGFFATAGAATATSLVPAGFAFTRTTSQVLAIVYGAGTLATSGTSKGGFFPNGFNGLITTI
jgi:hypothetical protein